MNHIILLGDSIFDNAPYTSPCLIDQLRGILPTNWQATLLATDGHMTNHIPDQLSRLPSDASHFVISAGGNDLLGHFDIQYAKMRSVTEILLRLADIAYAFEQKYQKMLDIVLGYRRPTALCTIYYPNFPDKQTQTIAKLGIALFNDVIIKTAFQTGLPIIDLRLICNDPQDYANPIEPAAHGGIKIAHIIKRVVVQHDFNNRRSQVYF